MSKDYKLTADEALKKLSFSLFQMQYASFSTSQQNFIILDNEWIYLQADTKPVVLLQPLRWRCTDCVIHHERDVREQQCVARKSNNSVIAACELLLLLAATVRSFVHLPLGLSDRNQKVLWPGCGGRAMWNLVWLTQPVSALSLREE